MDNDINREINIEQVEFGINIDNIEYSIEINPRDTFAIELNEQGPQGARGYTGNGISSYELTSSSGLTDTYTITFTDGNTTTVDVTNGRGITSITGPVSVGNVDTYTINYNDSTTSTFTVTNGINGVNPTVSVGTTTTGNPGTNASVINSGTTQDIVLDFTIPRGDKGETGEDGADGFSPIATVSKAGNTATISITDINGTTTTTISDGTDGQDGTAATIAVGTVTTGLPTDPASVTNVGTSSAAIFDFTIPKGDKGDTGATGNGIASITKTSTVGLVDTYTILYTDGNSTTFTVTNGANGTGSVADVWVNGVSVLDGNIAKVIVPTNNNQLTNGAGYITTSALTGYATETYVDTGLATKQATLVSGTNIKTINNNSILGSGNLALDGLPSQTGQSGKFLTTDGTDASWEDIPINQTFDGTSTNAQSGVAINNELSTNYQSKLVSGTNIKTLNGNSILGSGNIAISGKNVGEIVPSILPLTDAGLHLLDGSLLQYGIYKEFIDYIADLYTQDPTANYFTTESAWQSSVTTYGSCGKFVYDSVNNTVRLPKVTGKIEGTTDVTALGDLAPLLVKLPNITGKFTGQYGTLMSGSGAFYNIGVSSHVTGADSGGNGIGFNASRSSSVYSGNGTDTTIHEQAIKVLYYIVIANSTKTDIEVDIDEVTTDLNGKCDTDPSNMTASASAKNTIISWGMPDYSAGVSVTSYTSSSNQFTAPCDGIINWGANRANSTIAYVNNLRWNTYYGINATLYSNCTIPLNKGDKFYATAYDDNGDLCNMFFPLKGAN